MATCLKWNCVQLNPFGSNIFPFEGASAYRTSVDCDTPLVCECLSFNTLKVVQNLYYTSKNLSNLSHKRSKKNRFIMRGKTSKILNCFQRLRNKKYLDILIDLVYNVVLYK